MQLLDLPTEIFDKILLDSVHARDDVARALRLNLVCSKRNFESCEAPLLIFALSETFKRHLRHALFESRLLDVFYASGLRFALTLGEQWQIRKDHGCLRFWHDYYMYRVQVETVQNGTNPRTGRFVEIRQIAEEFNRQTQVGVKETTEALCWLALEGWKASFRAVQEDYGAPNLDLNLLSAAAYFNNLPLAKRLLAEGHIPTETNNLFPPAMEIAAWAGNAYMLELFQESLPEFEDLVPRFHADKRTWRGKLGPGSIRGAALRGDLDMLRLAIYPPSRANPDDSFAGQPFGKVDSGSKQGGDLNLALYDCKNPETYKYLRAFLEEPNANINFVMSKYAEMGNLDMVRYLLDTGAAQMQGVYNTNPLQIAIRYGHMDIIDMLLERGIDVNGDNWQARGKPIMVAADSGCMSMVRKLLDAGAEHTGYEELLSAIRLEHTEMANFFLDIYTKPPKLCSWSSILRIAEEEGLESMAQLLRQRGVKPPDPAPPKKPDTPKTPAVPPKKPAPTPPKKPDHLKTNPPKKPTSNSKD
jgi:hypothetical protein